jgi:hypothetical protein
MSTHPATVPATASVEATAAAPIGRARAAIVAVALATGSAAVAVLLLLQPGNLRTTFDYADIAAARDATFASDIVDGLGFAIAGVALAISVCVLARARGAAWANVGAVLMTLAGMLFAATEIAWGTLTWYATAPDALPVESGGALIRYLEHNTGHVDGLQVPAFLAYNVGALLLCAALWRARAVPRWLPIAITVLTVAQFVTPQSLANVEEAVLMLTFIPVGWFLIRAAR